jgi:hypothetical protein
MDRFFTGLQGCFAGRTIKDLSRREVSVFRQADSRIFFLVLGTLLVCVLFVATQTLGSSGGVGDIPKDSYDGHARVFVKGNHAYVLRHDGQVNPNSYLWIFDVDTVGNSVEETTFTEACCDSIYIPHASDLFVSDDHLYVGGLYDASTCILARYDISDPCEPEFLDSAYGWISNGVVVTEIYVTGDRAYLAIDASGVAAFDLSDTLIEWDATYQYCSGCGCSAQGVHVRGKYMYVADEDGGPWVYDLDDDTAYHADSSGYASWDLYNVVCSGESRTYEATNSYLNMWDTDDLEDISKVGSNNTSGHIVHVTGYWVYLLNNVARGPVNVFALVCDGNPELKKSYGDDLHDFHVVHDSRDYAHIYGVKPVSDSDTSHVLLWYKRAKHQMISRVWQYGDINLDQDVDIADLYILSRYVIAGDDYPVPDLDACDVNCDGEANTDDYDYLLNYLFYQGPAPGADCEFYH